MEIIISKEEILKLAVKLKSSKGEAVETMRYSITVDIQPDTDIFTKESSKPSLNFIQDCFKKIFPEYNEFPEGHRLLELQKLLEDGSPK